MQKCIIISIRPEWVEKILNGKKTIEIRKSIPKCDLPINVYIYCTKGKGTKKQPSLCCMTLYDYNEETGKFEKVYTEYALNAWKSLSLDGKIVAKFTLNKVERFDVPYPAYFYEVKEKLQHITDGSCLKLMSLHHYLKNDSGYAWHIDNLEIFDKPMELNNFYINNFETKFEYMDCGFQICEYGIQHYMLGDDCYPHNCPKMRVSKPPQSWCYAWR